MAAVRHRDVKILRAWVEWRRDIRVTFAERKRTSGRNAMRRVAITFAVWYEFMREMRSLRRPMLKYIESQQQTQGGVWHGGRFIGPGTTPAEKAKRLALARLKARRRLDTHVKFANHSLSYVGPCIEAAARSRCGRMMKHLRARPDFDSVADWYGLRWENMMENKYLFAWTGVGVYSGTDLGTSAVDVDVDTEPGPSGEAFDESAEPSPVEKVDAAADDESAVYLEPLNLDGSRRLADAADASSIDGTSFYVTPAMTPAASPAPKPPGSLIRAPTTPETRRREKSESPGDERRDPQAQGRGRGGPRRDGDRGRQRDVVAFEAADGVAGVEAEVAAGDCRRERRLSRRLSRRRRRLRRLCRRRARTRRAGVNSRRRGRPRRGSASSPKGKSKGK